MPLMAHVLVALLQLCCLLQCVFRTAGVRTSEEIESVLAHEEGLDLSVSHEGKAPDNWDRITCLRQDNLDIVLPSSKDFVLRRVQAISWDKTEKDLYVSATGIQLERFQAKLVIRRLNEEQFEFTLSGDREHKKEKDIIEVDFALTGLDILTGSTFVDIATSLFTNRDEMKKRQEGKLFFKMHGVGEAVWNKTTASWEVKFTKSTVEPCSVKVTGHWLVTKAAKKYGGIDEIIKANVVPIIEQALPAAFGVAFHYVPQNEFWYEVTATMLGEMPKVNGPLKFDMKVRTEIYVTLAKVLDVFLKVFDVDQLVEKKVAAILGRRDLKRVWRRSKEKFILTLERYGLVLGAEFLETAKKTKKLEELRPALTEAAKVAANKLVLNMGPFLEAYKRGQTQVFNGLVVNVQANGKWSKDTDAGSIVGSIKEPNAKPHIYPASLLRALEADKNLVLPNNSGGSMVALEGISVAENKVQIAQTRMVQLLAKHQNETYRLDGLLDAFSVLWPTPLLKASSVEVPYISLGLQQSGDVHIDAGKEGIKFHFGQAASSEKKPNQDVTLIADVRDGAETSLDGVVPKDYARPTLEVPKSSRIEMLPEFDLGMTFSAVGAGQQVNVTFDMSMTTQVEIMKSVAVSLAPRPWQDFGYTFSAGKFVWVRKFEKDNKPVEVPNRVVVVLSCGFLRIYALQEGKPLDNLKFTPTANGGQMELDVSVYTGPLKSNIGSSGRHCIDLATQGLAPRKVSTGAFSSDLVHDVLCSDRETAKHLEGALNMQIERFRADTKKTQEWNYGTHEAETDMYVLRPGQATKDLTSIIREREKDEVLMLGEISNEPTAAVHVPQQLREEESVASLPTQDKEVEIKGLGMLEETAKDEEVVDEEVVMKEEKMSYDRKFCLASDALDMLYFPPKKEKSQIIRMAMPDIPAVGDVFMQLDDLFLTAVECHMTVGRKNDDTFSFEVTGVDGEEKGLAHFFLAGLEFVTPESVMAGGVLKLVQGVAAMENFISSLTPWGSDNYGRLDTGPMDVNFHIKGDFKLKDNEWVIVQETVVTTVDINFASGGLVQMLVGTMIKSKGGMDQIFFDNVWPVVQKAIPPTLGIAFRTVPASAGDIKYALKITAVCPSSKDGRQCPDRKVQILAEGDFETKGDVGKILGIYTKKMKEAKVPVPQLVQNIAKGYEDKPQVFKGSRANVNLRAAFDETLTIASNLGMRTELTNDLMSILAGGEGSPGQDFLPESGKTLELQASTAYLKRGIAKIPELNLSNVRLPLATNDGMDAALVNVSLKAISLMRLDGPEAGRGELDPFGPKSPLHVSVEDLAVKFSRVTGLKLKFNQDRERDWMVRLHRDFLEELLRPKAQLLLSERLGRETEADGEVPDLYQKPYSLEPTRQDMREVLKGFNSDVNISLDSKCATCKGAREWIEFGINAKILTTLFMGKDVLRAAVDGSKRPDHGYMHLTVAGYLGERQGSSLPTATAQAVLHCGVLELFGLGGTPAQPYASANALLAVDLRAHLVKHGQKAANEFWKVTASDRKGWSCLFLGDHDASSMYFWTYKSTIYFCALEEEVVNLQKGIQLQQTRFLDVERAFNVHKGREAWSLPDGTWFQDIDPYRPSTIFPMQRRPTKPEQVQAPLDVFAAAQKKMAG